MPAQEGLVKISQGLYDTILPMVKTQVESQIKVRDLSNAAVTIAPADFGSWEAVRDTMLSEAKDGLKARVQVELAHAADGDSLEELKDAFAAEERALEHSIDHDRHTFSCALDVSYNVRARARALPRARPAPAPAPAHHPPSSRLAVPQPLNWGSREVLFCSVVLVLFFLNTVTFVFSRGPRRF